MEASEVRSFYDDFLESTMLEYRVRGNKRIDRAVQRIEEYVQQDSLIVDIGCGIGIVSERLADHAKDGHIWAFDISDRNIWYANKTINNDNIHFFSANVVEDSEKIKKNIEGKVDIFSLVDVIEHIPKEKHKSVFDFVEEMASRRAFIIITYPSPQFQNHLADDDPKKLQIIDQVIRLCELVDTANSAGFSLCHYSLETVWKRNQYVHCVFQNDGSITEPQKESRSFRERVIGKIRSVWKRKIIYPFRRWWYVDKVFEDSEHLDV